MNQQSNPASCPARGIENPSGLCAFPFAKAGMQVFGLDASHAMLNIVRSKGITVDLKQFDIHIQPGKAIISHWMMTESERL
jgi:hypothetical protein